MINLNLIGDKWVATRWIPEAKRLLKLLEMCITNPLTGVKGISRTYHDGTIINVGIVGGLETINIRGKSGKRGGSQEWKLLYRAWDNYLTYPTNLIDVPDIQWIEALKTDLSPDAAWADIGMISDYPSIESYLDTYDMIIENNVPIDEWYHAATSVYGMSSWQDPLYTGPLGSYPQQRDIWLRRVGYEDQTTWYEEFSGLPNILHINEMDINFVGYLAALYQSTFLGHSQLGTVVQPDVNGYDKIWFGHVNWIPVWGFATTELNAYQSWTYPVAPDERNPSSYKSDSEFIFYYDYFHEDHKFYIEPYTNEHWVNIPADQSTGLGYTVYDGDSWWSGIANTLSISDKWGFGKETVLNGAYCPTHFHHCAGVEKQYNTIQSCMHPTYGSVPRTVASATRSGGPDGIQGWVGNMAFPQRGVIYKKEELLNSDGKPETEDVIVTSYWIGGCGGSEDYQPTFDDLLSSVVYEYWSKDNHVATTYVALNGFGMHELKSFRGNMYYGGFGHLIAAMVVTEKEV